MPKRRNAPQLPEVNDCASLVGEYEEADKYRTCKGRAIRYPNRRVGVGASIFCFACLLEESDYES